MIIPELIISLSILFLSTTLLLRSIFYTREPNLHRPPSPLALPILGHLHLLGPIIHHSFHDLSSRHGPLFLLRLGSVQCWSPRLSLQKSSSRHMTFSSRQHSAAIKRLTYGVSFAFAPYGPYWKLIKKLATMELLGTRSLNHFLPIRTNEIRQFLEIILMKADVGWTVNVTEELLKLTNNVMSQMMFSIKCSGKQGEGDEAKILCVRNLDLQGFNKRTENIHQRYDALLEKIIADRERARSNKKDRRCDDAGKDFLDLLLDVLEDDKSDEVKITREHIKALILDFLTAATDTSAIATEWALAELINNPTVLKKAQGEIDQVVGRQRLVQESDGPNLPYIQAIIKETMRLHPPIPMIIRKSTQHCTVDGYHIPANTMLFVNFWSIGRNPGVWESPLEFRPERFFEPGKGPGPMGFVDVKGQHFQLLPFGTGRRGCPGMSLAMQELPAVLAAMIQCFEWKAVKLGRDGLVDMSEGTGLTAPRAHDLVCAPVLWLELALLIFCHT
ncbi:LOW QUALITY PROTEIN: hypothetical protein RJ640_015531, partial [Escallonia rubra]